MRRFEPTLSKSDKGNKGSKGSYQTDNNGVTVKVDEYGQKLWSRGTFITEKPKQRSK